MEIQAGELAPSPDSSIGDSFAWALRDPDWFGKLVVMGLISLIPIVGWLQLVGWMLTSLDNLRHGNQQLPPAAFRYASRGVYVFLAGVAWWLITLVLVYGVMGLVLFATIGLTPKSSGGAPTTPSLVIFPLEFGLIGLFGVTTLIAFLFAPMIVLFVDRTGFRGAFNIPGFVRALRDSPGESLAAGGLTFVSYLISGLGTYLCYVGLLFTIPYSMTVVAGVLRWYEVHARPGALPGSVAA